MFAYGQTGTGKTFTMEGPELDSEIVENSGILPRVAHVMDEEVANCKKVGTSIKYEVGAIEIYCEAVRDLLGDDDNLEVRGTGKNVFCAGQQWIQISNVAQFM